MSDKRSTAVFGFSSSTPRHRASPRTGQRLWSAALVAFVLWAGLAAGATWLLLHGWASHPPVQVTQTTSAPPPLQAAALTRLLSAPEASAARGDSTAETAQSAPEAPRVVGVIANDRGGGVALLQVGQSPVQAVRVGTRVDGVGVVQSITADAVRLGPSLNAPTDQTLQPPQLPAPQW